MKSAALLWSTVVFAVAIASSARGQEHAVGLAPPDTYSSRSTGLGTNSQNTSGASASATPDPENNTAEHDDELYRSKTTDSENPMLRDEGALHFKTHPKEKINEVDSLKNLQTTRSDPKFQGSFVTSGVSSIKAVAEKANELGEVPVPVPAPAPAAQANQGDPRFGQKHLAFNPEKEDEPKKMQAGASPSPTPSPTTSPAKNSGNSKQ